MASTPRNGENTTTRHVALENTELNLNIDSIKVHLTNLFNGDRLLGKTNGLTYVYMTEL